METDILKKNKKTKLAHSHSHIHTHARALDEAKEIFQNHVKGTEKTERVSVVLVVVGILGTMLQHKHKNRDRMN